MPYPNKKQTNFVRPVADGWELWNFGSHKGPVLMQTFKNCAEIKPSSNCIFGLTVASTIHLPVWLVRTEPEFLPDLISAQLEKRGLLNADLASTVWSSEISAATETHDLRLINVVPENIPQDIVPTWCDSYDLAARFQQYEGDSVYIWKELGLITVAFVRQSNASYFHTLQHKTLTIEALMEINILQLSLEAQRITSPPTQLRLWGTFSEEELAAARESFDFPLINPPLPAPRIPQDKHDLTPGFVRQIKAQQKKRTQLKRNITTAALTYIAIFSLLGLYILGLIFQRQLLAKELASKQPSAESVSQARARWLAIESIIEPSYSVLEVLLRISSLLQGEGVRFTSFEMDNETIIIQAEASNFNQAFTFAEDVKNSPDLTLYTWQSPNPVLLPNNKAQFQILGRSIYATSNIQ